MIIVNGGSSSGKTSIVRHVQDMVSEPWLAISIDDFVDSLPPRLQQSSEGFDITGDGTVQIGDVFRQLEKAWMAGVIATARAGASVLLDDVFLGAAASQTRWRAVLTDLPVAWVGVHCRVDVAQQREASRLDRNTGMAAQQATQVHIGVDYDVQVDTTSTSAMDCAQLIISKLHLSRG